MSAFTDYLTGIADAIRTKKGTAEPIPAASFANEIATLDSGGQQGLFLDLTPEFSFIDSNQADELFEGFDFSTYAIEVSDITFT